MRLPLASLIVLYSTRKWRYFLWVRSISVNSKNVLLCATMNKLKTRYWHFQIQRLYWVSIQNMDTLIPWRIAPRSDLKKLILDAKNEQCSYFASRINFWVVLFVFPQVHLRRSTLMNTHPQKDSCKVWSYTVGRSDDMAWPNKSPSTQESYLPTLPDIMELFQIFDKGIDNFF